MKERKPGQTSQTEIRIVSGCGCLSAVSAYSVCIGTFVLSISGVSDEFVKAGLEVSALSAVSYIIFLGWQMSIQKKIDELEK